MFWNSQASATTALNVNEVASGTVYELRVRAICDEANSLFSTFSAISDFSTEGEIFCEVPGCFNITGITTGTATINWIGTANLYYQLRYRLKKMLHR